MPSESTSKPDITIRQFRDDDLPEVAAIFEYGMMLYAKNTPASRQCWAEYVRKSLKDDLADIKGTYMATGGNFWVAALEDNNGESTVIGMAALEPKGNGEGEVRRVSIHPGYHRMGVGRKLMVHLEQWATTHNFKTLTLSASNTEKSSAVDFYTSFGFESGESFAFMKNPRHVGVWMSKKLS